jgi:hypothetical protein
MEEGDRRIHQQADRRRLDVQAGNDVGVEHEPGPVVGAQGDPPACGKDRGHAALDASGLCGILIDEDRMPAAIRARRSGEVLEIDQQKALARPGVLQAHPAGIEAVAIGDDAGRAAGAKFFVGEAEQRAERLGREAGNDIGHGGS